MKKLIGLISGLIMVVMILNNSSCGYDYLEPVIIVIPDTVSFSQDIIPVFDNSCSLSGCHVAGGVAPDLTANNAWFELWIYEHVDTVNPTSSVLYKTMNSESEPMPPNGKLTEDKIQLVLAWIDQGARDN